MVYGTVRNGGQGQMTHKDPKTVRIGVLGAGQIAQAAHFESAVKARNAELYAICDVAEDLLQRMAVAHAARKTFTNYEAMLADNNVDAVIIATADAFHVPAAKAALEAGKHVLCEKPLGLSVEEAESLRDTVMVTGKLLQVGHMKRFDAGLQSARQFIDEEIGDVLALKAWYCDSTHRYALTDAVQPAIVRSAGSKKPPSDPKADLKRYYMLAHGSHLVDLARYLCGEIVEVQTHYRERFGARSWFVDVEFASGAMGHLDLTVAVRMDWHEGFQLYGQHGSVIARIYNPWLYKTSDVDIFRESTGGTTRILGADGHFYRRQLEGFADAILTGKPVPGASIDDGVACIRAMVAIQQSAASGKPVRPEGVSGPV
jgi:predicted dehydrogenase